MLVNIQFKQFICLFYLECVIYLLIPPEEFAWEKFNVLSEVEVN